MQLSATNRRRYWDGKERRSTYTGKEHRLKDRRDECDRNIYGRLSVVDLIAAVGVFRVNPHIFTERNGFMEPAWIYDRRDKKYQEWRERGIIPLIQINPDNEEQTRKVHHEWDSRDLLKEMYVG